MRSVAARVALAVVVASALLLTLTPGRTWVKAAALAADALALPVPRPFAATVHGGREVQGGVTVARYSGGGGAPGVVLVPGATPEGLDDPRVVGLARALARSQRDVVVPQLALFGEDLTRADIARIRRVITAHARETGGPVVVLGISYGGSLALIAASEANADVSRTAVFGAYGDLVGVIQAVTTGVSIVDGDRFPWQAHPRALEVLRRRAAELLPRDARPALEAALAGEVAPEELPEPARAVHALLTNDDPEASVGLAARLPPRVRSRLEWLSPVHEVERIPGGLVILHARSDPLVPFGEAVRLDRRIADTNLLTLEAFRHVELEDASLRGWWQVGRDLTRVLRFAVAVLEPQEPLLPTSSRRIDDEYPGS